ncbi:MAG TPA: cobalt transport protein CbiN [Candidatus Gemmiger faecavium]|nr:cobalt transport protein CbiN [Candidatus Gemmiger faecavium]
MSKTAKWMIVMLAAVLLIVFTPLVVLRDADFGGSDDAGSEMVEEITGEAYEPWAVPVLEQFLGGELPGEVESLLFCVQTGIGVGVIAYGFGYLAARKKYALAAGKGQPGAAPVPSAEQVAAKEAKP